MGRPCEGCRHPDRLKLDRALRQKQPLASLARKYVISVAALARHSKGHLLSKPATVADLSIADPDFESWLSRAKLESAADVLAFARFQVYRLEKLTDRAESDGDLRTAMAGVQATLKTVSELFAKTSGLLADGAPADQSVRIVNVLSGISDDDLRAFLARPLTPKALNG
jgi:hypothetical protein